MSKDDKIWWEIPRRPDTEWLFKSELDEEEEEEEEEEEYNNLKNEENKSKIS